MGNHSFCKIKHNKIIKTQPDKNKEEDYQNSDLLNDL